MEIIRRGIKPEDVWFAGGCTNCKTEVRFQRKEGKYTDDRDGEFVDVCCPVCKCVIHGYKSNLQTASLSEKFGFQGGE